MESLADSRCYHDGDQLNISLVYFNCSLTLQALSRRTSSVTDIPVCSEDDGEQTENYIAYGSRNKIAVGYTCACTNAMCIIEKQLIITLSPSQSVGVVLA